MNKKSQGLILFSFLLLLIFLGVVLFNRGFVSSPDKKTTKVTKTVLVEPEEKQEVEKDFKKDDLEVKKSSFKDIIEKEIGMKCVWQKDENISATTFIKGKKYYGEIKKILPSLEEQISFILFKDNCIWSWIKEGQGIKACSKEENESIWENESLITGPDYECQEAVFDDNIFNPPLEIEFIEEED